MQYAVRGALLGAPIIGFPALAERRRGSGGAPRGAFMCGGGLMLGRVPVATGEATTYFK